MTSSPLFAWLPAEHRKPLLQRLLIVWCIALLIALGNWAAHEETHQTFDKALVYAYAISTVIWLLTDVPRFVFKRLLHVQAPNYWPPALPATLMLLVGIPLGYVLGTLVGDAYAGWSTWDLWHFNPGRFKGMLVSSVAISAAFVAYFYQRGKAESLANQVTQAQLMLLQSQLEPHMLFNTLAHLRALIGQDTVRALTMLDHLNDYLRTTLQGSRQPLHPLTDEFARLHDYLSLMAIRMGPRLTFEMNLPEGLGKTLVPSFILQPLVENAIRHGLEPQVAGGHIALKAFVLLDELKLSVTDNGCGISDLVMAQVNDGEPAADNTASWGLAHVSQRLNALYGQRARLNCSRRSPTGGTYMQVSLPYTFTPD